MPLCSHMQVQVMHADNPPVTQWAMSTLQMVMSRQEASHAAAVGNSMRMSAVRGRLYGKVR